MEPEREFVLERGEGVYVIDESGNQYLDGTASLWYCNVGHGRGEIAHAAYEQMTRLATYSTFGDMANPPASALAEKISSLVPLSAARVFLTNGGSDAIDTAIKLARQYYRRQGEPGKTVFIARERAYHGMNVGGTALGAIKGNVEGYGPLLLGVVRVPWNSAEAVAEAIDTVGQDRVCAFFCEPVVGGGGVLAPPEGYLARVAEICRERDVLLVFDEVITGFGRTGAWFAADRYGTAPDMIVFAKGVTSGYLPLGGLAVDSAIFDRYWSDPSPWRHGFTYSGHATAAAAALANIEILERERLVESTASAEDQLREVLEPIAAHPLVGEVRVGPGLLAGVELRGDVLEEVPESVDAVVREARGKGLLTRAIANGTLQISPPLTISRRELGELSDALLGALSAVSELIGQVGAAPTSSRPARGIETAAVPRDPESG